MPNFELGRIDRSPNWYIVWTENRRSKRRSTGTSNYRQAEEVLAAFRLEVSQEPAADMSIALALEHYYDNHAQHLASAQQAKIAIGKITTFYGATMISGLSYAHHQRYIAWRRALVGDETISRELSVLRATLNMLHKHGLIGVRPGVPSLPKAPPRERILTRQEAARLLRACEGHLLMFVRLAMYTGARPSSILDLTWDRVDLDGRLIFFPLPGKSETNKRRAVVPVEGALYTALARHRRRTNSDFVISYKGAQVARIKRSFATAARNAELPGVTPYVLRHTAASWASQNGVSISEISRTLGHSDERTTQRYIKYHPDHLRNATRAMLRGARKCAQNNKGPANGTR